VRRSRKVTAITQHAARLSRKFGYSLSAGRDTRQSASLNRAKSSAALRVRTDAIALDHVSPPTSALAQRSRPGVPRRLAKLSEARSGRLLGCLTSFAGPRRPNQALWRSTEHCAARVRVRAPRSWRRSMPFTAVGWALGLVGAPPGTGEIATLRGRLSFLISRAAWSPTPGIASAKPPRQSVTRAPITPAYSALL
jgi:hypothetical protein